QIRAYLTGAGPIAIVDLPWIPVFLLICFLIHPWLGLAATVGGIVLFTMALLTERASRTPARTAAQDAGMRSIMVEATRRGGETIVASGMSGSLSQRWAAGQQSLYRRRRRPQRCGRFVWQHIEGAEAFTAVDDPRPRRVSGDQTGAHCRSDDRCFDHDGSRAGTDRGHNCELARFRCRPANA